MKKRNKVPAIFGEDIQELLQSINEIVPIENGERLCIVCSKTISLDNIQIIIPRSGNVFQYVCNNPNCIEDYNCKTPSK